MVFGTAGAILFSLYIKRTFNYTRALRVASIGSTVMLMLLCLWLNTANVKAVTSIVLAVMGFIVTPVIPICYDLGCELSFPMGEAQVTGLLNGGGLMWAFISSAFVSGVIGYGSTKSSLIIILTLSGFVLGAAVLFFFLKIDLKRRNYEAEMESRPREQGLGDKTENTEPSERESPDSKS
jgi:FLVCR family feline leukemia virus subgroup C receptor-related protein